MTKSDHRKPINFVGLTSMAKTIEPVRSSHKSVMAIGWRSLIARATTSRHPHWKCCPPLTSTRSVTIVAHAIGNSLPMLKLGRGGSLG